MTPGPWTIAEDGTIEARDRGLVGQLKYASPEDRAAIEQTPRVRALLEDLLQAVETGTVTPVLIRACRDAL